MNLRLGSVPFQFPRAKGLCLTLPPKITGPSITPACSELHLHLTLISSAVFVYRPQALVFFSSPSHLLTAYASVRMLVWIVADCFPVDTSDRRRRPGTF